MEEKQEKVTLHGMWASTYVKRVQLALTAKGIAYEYVEEDLGNKSQLLLQYNPVQKKVPVLVDNGKPVAESSVFLEYIDETWKQAPRLLPEVAYEKAKVRFWASFIQQQLFEGIGKVITSDGRDQERAIEELQEKMSIFEEEMKKFFPDGAPVVKAESLGLLDILVVATFGPYRAQEEVIGRKILDPDRNPLIFSWVAALNQLPLVVQLQLPHDKLVGLLLVVRNNAL